MNEKLIYEGSIYIRPCGRGIVLTGLQGEPELEDIMRDGDYEAKIIIKKADQTQTKKAKNG